MSPGIEASPMAARVNIVNPELPVLKMEAIANKQRRRRGPEAVQSSGCGTCLRNPGRVLTCLTGASSAWPVLSRKTTRSMPLQTRRTRIRTWLPLSVASLDSTLMTLLPVPLGQRYGLPGDLPSTRKRPPGAARWKELDGSAFAVSQFHPLPLQSHLSVDRREPVFRPLPAIVASGHSLFLIDCIVKDPPSACLAWSLWRYGGYAPRADIRVSNCPLLKTLRDGLPAETAVFLAPSPDEMCHPFASPLAFFNSSEVSRMPISFERLPRMAWHMLHMHVMPDIFITPSKLRHFAHLHKNVVLVNPGYSTLGQGGGTYAKIILMGNNADEVFPAHCIRAE
ncbi:hypothetical protein DL89DRAFT_269981, partial [Linderina pennispora]